MVYEQLYFGKKSWVFLTWNELKKKRELVIHVLKRIGVCPKQGKHYITQCAEDKRQKLCRLTMP